MSEIPVIPKIPDEIKKLREGPQDPNPVVAICGECGLHIHAVMGYACPNRHCPTGLGGAQC